MGLHLSTLASASSATETQHTHLEALRPFLDLLAQPVTLHDWTAPTWDQKLTEHLVWSFDHGTTQDAASKTLAAVRWAMQPTTRYEAPRHLSPASRAGNVGNRRHPAHRRPGCLGCWWLDGLPSTTRNSWVSTSDCSELGDAVHDSLRSSPSSIACLQGWKRWEPASSRPPAPRVLGLLVARWLAEHNQKLMGFYFWLQ